MSTNPIARYLAYANLQMAAEALYDYEITSSNPVALTKPVLDAAVLIKGNDHTNKFPEALAADFVTKYVIVAHQPNTSTGFSGTLFRAIKDDPATDIDTLQFQGDLGPADVVLSRISKRLVANDIQWKIAA